MIREIKTAVKKKLISNLYSFSRICSFPFIKPDFLQLNLTTRCNLKCRICSFKDEHSDILRELNLLEIKEMALQAYKWKLNNIILSGGEPFLRSDIFEILDVIKKEKMSVIITTNGCLLDDDKINKLNDTSLKHLQVSLDGACAKTHDYIRGENTFEATVANVKKIVAQKDRRYSIGLSFTVMPYNYKEMEDFLKLGKRLGVDTVLFIPVICDNSYRTLDEGEKLFEFGIGQIGELRKSFSYVEGFVKENLKPEVSNFDNMRDYWKYFEGRKNEWKCYAGFRWLQINPYGTAKMCGWEYDDFRKNPDLKKIWYSKNAFRIRRKIKKCSILCMQPCMSKPV